MVHSGPAMGELGDPTLEKEALRLRDMACLG